MLKNFIIVLSLFSITGAFASEIRVRHSSADLGAKAFDESIWKDVPEATLTLMGQPMVVPKPKTVTTSSMRVQALEDGKTIAIRMRWKADKPSEAGKLGEFSDAVAVQFAVKDWTQTPIFMGGKGFPAHIFHWRAQYQRDAERGKPEMKDLYPNMSADMYPMEFADSGSVKGLDEKKREVYSPGKVEGNPQSHVKASAVDEMIAEGFSTSTVVENKGSLGRGVWANGEWSVTLSRKLKNENGSILEPSKDSAIAFAIWQGAKQEVGSRKCLTLSWLPLTWEK